MRRIIFTTVVLMLVGGVAAADGHRGRSGGNHGGGNHGGGSVVRDHRSGGHGGGHNSGYRTPVRTQHDGYRQGGHQQGGHQQGGHGYRQSHGDRRPVYSHNGRYTFHDGSVRSHSRPVTHDRHYDYRHRPQVIVQNYDPVPGYIWVQGQWSWSGYEWLWVDGYWTPDRSYYSNY